MYIVVKYALGDAAPSSWMLICCVTCTPVFLLYEWFKFMASTVWSPVRFLFYMCVRVCSLRFNWMCFAGTFWLSIRYLLTMMVSHWRTQSALCWATCTSTSLESHTGQYMCMGVCAFACACTWHGTYMCFEYTCTCRCQILKNYIYGHCSTTQRN